MIRISAPIALAIVVAGTPVVLAQEKTLNLEAPSTDYRPSQKDAEQPDGNADTKVSSHPSGVSLSVSGQVAGEVTSSNGSTGRPAR